MENRVLKINEDAYKIGIYSSIIAGICTVLFAVFLFAGLSKDTTMLQFAVCLVLAVAYVFLINVLYSTAAPEKKLYGRISVSLVVIYAVYICMSYYTQITIVAAGSVTGEALSLLKYTPGSWIFAMDMLGYVFLTLSTLTTAFMFERKGLEGLIRLLMLIHGALAVPTFIFPMLPMNGNTGSSDSMKFGGTFALVGWCVLFAPICFFLCRYFILKKTKGIYTAERGIMPNEDSGTYGKPAKT